jgi:probable HAF family extracellular repeat protein
LGSRSGATGNESYFAPVGDLPGGWFASSVRSLSFDGRVAYGGGSSSTTGAFGEPFRWSRETGIVALDAQDQLDDGSLQHASSDGLVAVGCGLWHGARRVLAFRWTAETGMVALGDLPGGHEQSCAHAVSADGSVIVGVGETELSHNIEGFIWTAENGMAPLGDLPGGAQYSVPTDISNDGAVVVGYSWSDRGHEAFRWTAGDGMAPLGDLNGGGVFSYAYAVSADGRVIVGEGTTPVSWQGWRWTAETGMVKILSPWGRESHLTPTAVNRDGSIIVGNSSTGRHWMFIWDETHGVRDLIDMMRNGYFFDLSGWGQLQVTAMSDDGSTVAGWGSNAEGNTEGWVAHFGDPPPPCDPRHDLNHDGLVMTDDLTLLLANYGLTSATAAQGDFDGDGVVDLDDVALFLAYLGEQC